MKLLPALAGACLGLAILGMVRPVRSALLKPLRDSATPASPNASDEVRRNPWTDPIGGSAAPVLVNYREFAVLPALDRIPARPMLLSEEPGTRNLFINDMRGPLYRISPDGQTVTEYLNIDDPKWNLNLVAGNPEAGFQSFAFHPQFRQAGMPGFGKFYTWGDITDKTPTPDFRAPGGNDSHDNILLEWSARKPAASAYDGGAPRVLFRIRHPFPNHNGGMLAFNPLAQPGQPDFGMLYVGNADGGSGTVVDPFDLSQNPEAPIGKILRIDPLGRNSTNGKYGIPADNPFVEGGSGGFRREVWALGVRNPQRFTWDVKTGKMYLSDVGQRSVEELNIVPKGGNLGWKIAEGSYKFGGRYGVDTTAAPRSDPTLTYPIAEYDHKDGLLGNNVSTTGVVVYRGAGVPQIQNRILFGDIPSGEVFHISADDSLSWGQDHIRRLLFNDKGEAKTLLQLMRQKNVELGQARAARADLRFGTGPGGQVFILNKGDGVIRLLVK